MQALQRTLLLVTALTFALAFPSAVLAQSTSTPDIAELGRYGIFCNGKTCTVKVTLPNQNLDEMRPLLHGASLVLNVLQENISLLPDGAGFQVSDALNLTFPLGGLPLIDTDLTVEIDDSGAVQKIAGSAVTPALDALNVGLVHIPTTVSFGYDQGANLDLGDAPLLAGHSYLYLKIGNPTTGPAPLQQGPPHTYALIVADAESPFLYIDSAATMRASSLALMEALLPLNPLAESLMDWTLAPQQAGGRVVAQWTGEPATSFMKIQGAYAIDGGLLTRWLPFEFAPLAIDSLALVDGGGLRLTAGAQSIIAPNVLGEGALLAALYIPFNASQELGLHLAATLDAPGVGGHWAGDVELGDDLAHIARVVSEINRTAQEEFLAPGYAYASQAATASYQAAADATGRAFYWAANASGQALTVVIDATGRAIASVVDGSGQLLSLAADEGGAVVNAAGSALAATAAGAQAAGAWTGTTAANLGAAVVSGTGDVAAATAAGAQAAGAWLANGAALAYEASTDVAGNAYSATVSAPGRILASITQSEVVECGLTAAALNWCADWGFCAPQGNPCANSQVADAGTE